jgi:hypothetical protein
MNVTFSHRPWYAFLAAPVVLFGLIVAAPAAPPTELSRVAAQTVLRKNSAAQKTAAQKNAAAKKSQAQKNKSALGKTAKKHKHHRKHHKHHHKHHKKSRAANSNVSADLARVQHDEQTLNRDTNRLRRALK